MSQSKSQPKTSPAVMTATVIMGILILLPSMVGFINKLFEFKNVLQGDIDGLFTLTPIANYTFASLGFFCLLIWATAQGMFHNIEGPKHTMLDREGDLDSEETNYVPKWAGGPETEQTKS